MRIRFWPRRGSGAVLVLMCGAWSGTPLAAQAPAADPATREIVTDPIKCWWKTDASAVHIGEHFTLALTCGVIEADRFTVVPKTDPLDPSAVQLTPFEVIGGTRHEDIQAPPWRYFQYEYTLRLLGPEFFGQDIDIPSLTVTYNIQSDVAGAAQGRDQVYVLPALPMRVVSLVPKNVTDIRDAPLESFANIEARLFRATSELLAGAVLFAFAVLLLALAAVRVIGRWRQRAPAVSRIVPAGIVLGGCLREVGRLRSEVAREGWTPERAGAALTAFRIGSAVAIGRPVAQTLVDLKVPMREGQLTVRTGIVRRKRILLSAPITSAAFERYRVNGNGEAPTGRSQTMLDELHESLLAFSAVRYGRNGSVEPAALDRALEDGRTALRRLRLAKLWPMRAAEEVAKSAAALGSMLWSR